VTALDERGIRKEHAKEGEVRSHGMTRAELGGTPKLTEHRQQV